jgi:hypothetical protein
VRSRPLLIYVLVVLLLASAGLAGQQLAETSWRAYVTYPSPFTVPLEPGAPGPALAQRVLLVVVDGLRVDAFERMSLVERYRARASLWRVWTGEPSLSYPGWTALLSGAPPEISGVTTNWYQGPVKVDHLLAAAKRSGLSIAAAGHPGWARLFAGAFDEFTGVPDPPYNDLPAIHDTTVVVTKAAERFLQGPARLILLHYPAPDLMGHGFGGTSQPYRDSVRLVDEELSRLLAGMDLSSSTVIITSDHGHLDRGGHGGWEQVVRQVPLLFLGAGIEPGEGFDGRQTDIAPTAAALLGLPLPAHSLGRPLTEALAGIPEGLDLRWGQQQAAFHEKVYTVAVLGRRFPVFTTPLGGPNPDAMLAAADDLARQRAEWLNRALARDRGRRLPLVVLLAVVPLAYLFYNRPRRDLLPALAGAAVFLGVTLGLFFGRGYYFSLSVINREELLLSFFQGRTVDAAIAVAAGALVAGWAARRRGLRAGALAGLSTAYLSAYALLLVVLLSAARWGVRFPYYLPDLREGLRYYLALLALTPVGLLAAPLVVVSMAGFAVGRVGERIFARRSAPAATPDTPSSAVAPARREKAAPVSTGDSRQSPP